MNNISLRIAATPPYPVISKWSLGWLHILAGTQYCSEHRDTLVFELVVA